MHPSPQTPPRRSRRSASFDDPAETQPRWLAIAEALRTDIAAGRLAPGERLPNEQMLAEHFGVHRHTVRQATQALAREGFLHVRQGSGTYVRELVLDYALKRRTRLTQNLAGQGEQAQRDLLGQAQQPAGTWGVALQLAARAPVQWLHTRATVRGRPIGLSEAVFPLPRCAGVLDAFVARRSISHALQACGVADYTRARSTIACRLPSADEALLLARPPAQPVLVVEYVNVDARGVPVEAGRTLFAADAVQLSVDGCSFGDEPLPPRARR